MRKATTFLVVLLAITFASIVIAQEQQQPEQPQAEQPGQAQLQQGQQSLQEAQQALEEDNQEQAQQSLQEAQQSLEQIQPQQQPQEQQEQDQQQQPGQTGSLEVTVEPAEATVVIMGPGGYEQAFSGGQTLTDLPAGRYIVSATSSGYNAATEEVNIEAGDTATIELTLEGV